METARAWGVPHSVLLGRVVRGGQPRFTAQDTAYAVALQQIEARTCGCGHDRALSMDPAREFGYVGQAVRCHACAARDRAAAAFTKAGGDTAGLMFTVHDHTTDPAGSVT